jgi:O-antigen/teichoic acid export membrane protein
MRKFTLMAVVLILLLAFVVPVRADEPPLSVYYAGPDGSVKTALELAKFDLTADLASADVVVLNDVIPNPAAIAARVEAGAGLVIVLGPDVTPEQLAPLLGAPPTLEAHNDAVSLKVDEGDQEHRAEGVAADVLWASAPQVRDRLELTEVQISRLVTAHKNGEMLLGETALGEGTIYVFTPFLDGANAQIQEWPYYNYTLYNLVTRAAGHEPVQFSVYPASPLPHARERIILYVAMAIMVVITWGGFFLVRRYSKAHPEALDTFVSGREAFVKREANTDWEQIGFHRSIGGFMFALMSGLLLFVPMVVYQNMILPVYILPSAQAMGMWGRVAGLFPLVWSLFDMGTSVAHMKYFAEYRVKNPRKAIQFAQFYVWWQALTGAVQVALVVTFASIFMPDTAYAILIWAIVSHTMIQIPGFYRIFTDSLSALQRADYNQILDIAMTMVIPMIVQPIVISLMVWWGRNNPIFGPAMGGLLGMGVAAYAMEVMSFVFGWWLYKRIGYNARLLFMAHFDWDVAIQSLKYGVFLFLAGIFGGISSSLNVIVIQNRLINTNEVLGNLGMAGNFPYAYTVLQTLTATVMPAVSEAISNGRKILSQYYAAMIYKFGGFISGFICAILLAVADRFIIGSSGQDFERAAVYVVPMLLIGALNFTPWIGSAILYGANNTKFLTLLAAVDFVLGLGITYLLVDRFQVYALIYTPLLTTVVRASLIYYINHRYSFPQRFYFWQTFGASALAGLVHYIWLRWATGLIWQDDEITSLLILLLALVVSYPVYAFFYGFFGGWDDNTLNEFGRGTNLASFMRPMARLFYHATRWGTRISPLHGRFPITIFDEAAAEARTLTEEKVTLI